MTIPKIAKLYQCNKSALYQKFKRRQAELEGHYYIEDGKIYIDNDAALLLLPDKIIKADYSEKLKQASKQNDDLSNREKELEQENEKLVYENLILTVKHVEEMGAHAREQFRHSMTKKEVELLMEDRDYYEKMLDELNAKIAELQNQISEKSRNGILSVFAKH